MKRAFAFALCADDYAMTPGVSRGILEALEAGALSATSVMTTSRWWPEAASALQAHADRADIGLHLNLTLGAPLGTMPRFAPSGRLPAIGTIVALAQRGRLPLDEIAGEIQRQMDRFVEVFGRPPDHVDGHQHVHVLGAIPSLLVDALQARGWMPWLRDSADRPWRILARRTVLKKSLGIALLSRRFAAQARQRGFPTNQGFAGFSDFTPKADYADQFARYLAAPGPRHLVMCHPGYVDDDLRALDPVVESREDELRVLLSRGFADLCEARGARLARLTTILAAPV